MKLFFDEKQLDKILLELGKWKEESGQWRAAFQSLIFQVKRFIDFLEKLAGKKGGEKQ